MRETVWILLQITRNYNRFTYSQIGTFDFRIRASKISGDPIRCYRLNRLLVFIQEPRMNKFIFVSRASLLTSVLLILSALATFPLTPVYAASFVVNTLNDDTNNDSLCTLREAILASNNTPTNDNCGAGSSADDTINFSVSGIVTLGSQLPNITDATTAGTLRIDGGDNITLSGNNAVRVLYVDGSGELTLNNLSVINGYTGYGGSGGGLHNDGGVVTIINSTFSSNSGTFGAGVYNFYGLKTDTTRIGTVTIVNSTFSDNVGVGLLNDGGMANITSSTFSKNTGGLSNLDGSTTIANSTLFGNQAEMGGALYNSGSVLVLNSTFYDNRGGRFAAIYSSSGAMTFKNTLIAQDDCNGKITSDSRNNMVTDFTCAVGATQVTLAQLDLGALTGDPAYFPLNRGSVAIDTANNPICAAPPLSNTSQNGITRPQDGDGNGTFICDIGTYEAPTPPDACTTKPDKPVLKQPDDKAILNTTSPTLKWRSTHCAGTYLVIVQDASSGVTVDRKKGLKELQYKTKSLAVGKTYKWFVKARNDFGVTKSGARTFTVK